MSRPPTTDILDDLFPDLGGDVDLIHGFRVAEDVDPKEVQALLDTMSAADQTTLLDWAIHEPHTLLHFGKEEVVRYTQQSQRDPALNPEPFIDRIRDMRRLPLIGADLERYPVIEAGNDPNDLSDNLFEYDLAEWSIATGGLADEIVRAQHLWLANILEGYAEDILNGAQESIDPEWAEVLRPSIRHIVTVETAYDEAMMTVYVEETGEWDEVHGDWDSLGTDRSLYRMSSNTHFEED